MPHPCFRLPALCLLAVILGTTTQAQQPATHQFTLVNENDNYAFSYTDRYYTNGIMLRYVAARPAASGKRTIGFEVGQQIFTPFTYSLKYRQFMDRPFTGLLYARMQHTRVGSSGRLWQWGVKAGLVGPHALGQQVQRWHHRTWNLRFPYGWEKQLKNGIGVNAEGRLVQPLVSLGSARFGFSADGTGSAELGTLQMQAGGGLLLRLGARGNTRAAAAYDTRVGSEPGDLQREWFFFYEPLLNAQWYNATLQGTLGQRAHQYYTTSPAPWVCQQKVGFVYAPQRWTAQVAFVHRSKEAPTMRNNENWGSLALGYRW